MSKHIFHKGTKAIIPFQQLCMNKVTKREIEIINLLIMEKSTNEIASELNISTNTVFTHKQSLFRKLKVKNSIGLTIKSLLVGLPDQKLIKEYYKIDEFQINF